MKLPPRFVMLNIHEPIQYPWDPDLGPAHIVTDWNTPAGLAFRSVDTLAAQPLNEGREVKVPQSESNYD